MFHVTGEGGYDAIESDGFILQGERQVEQVAAYAVLLPPGGEGLPAVFPEQLVELGSASPGPFMDTSPESRYTSKKLRMPAARPTQFLHRRSSG